MKLALQASLAILLSLATAKAQSTQAIIRGQVYDARTGSAIGGATVKCRNQSTGEESTAGSIDSGFYVFASMTPGTYWLRVTHKDYQPRELYELELPVAGRVQLDIPLRLASDVYGEKLYSASYLPQTDAIVHTYAADLKTTVAQPLAMLLGRSGTTQSTLSYLIDPRLVRDLPLSGRDVYTMLVTLPGVTADNPTARGLGVAVNGQRSSSSNFLLDGVENNDPLLTGPETVLAPEAVSEYRVSTSNFSAEFGRAAGFVANAITRSGSRSFHGLMYGYLNDTVLNSNAYQHKAGYNTSTGRYEEDASFHRQPQTQLHTGFWLGGPIPRTGSFWSGAYERFQNRSSSDPFPFQVPVKERMQTCFPGSRAVALLEEFRPPVPLNLPASSGSCAAILATTGLSARYEARPPITLDRNLALARVDHDFKGQRFQGRVAFSDISRPDFRYSPYSDFSMHYSTRAWNVAGAWLVSTPRMSNELRIAWRSSRQGWAASRPDIPFFSTASDGGRLFEFGIQLPGAFLFPYRLDTRSVEWSDTLRLVRGRHVISAGGGILFNEIESELRFRASGIYEFNSLEDFGRDLPRTFQISAQRAALQSNRIVAPNFSNRSRNKQFTGFVQDNVQLTQRLGLNLGIRYEYFGVPSYLGAADPEFVPGAGESLARRIKEGHIDFTPTRDAPFEADRNNLAARFGIFLDPGGDGRMVLRGGYGIFYDRPFGNLYQNTRNNNFELALAATPRYPAGDLSTLSGRPLGTPRFLWIDRGLRTPYVQSWFGGVQRQFRTNLYAEASVQSATGRKLIGTDLVNRPTLGDENLQNPAFRDLIAYRSNFVSSSYYALTSLARYRTARVHLQGSYTWGHSIDTQSDPLQGTFEDLNFSSPNAQRGTNYASLTHQFDTNLDRASSDFDQRHSLVLLSVQDIPAPGDRLWKRRWLQGWRTAQMAAFRSGFPVNVVWSQGLGLPSCDGIPASSTLVRPRPSLLPGRDPFLARPEAVPGGYKLLDPTAFCAPGLNRLGTLGRNALTGPGFWNLDLSVSKTLRAGWLGESGEIMFRADFFNALNHANLGNPDGLLDTGENSPFGRALLGRQGTQPSFPSATPLDQLPRQIQLQLRLIF